MDDAKTLLDARAGTGKRPRGRAAKKAPAAKKADTSRRTGKRKREPIEV
jgi:hypothetical protein